VPPRLLHRAIGAMQAKRFLDWSFGHYLAIAPPAFAASGPPPRTARAAPAQPLAA
jgi:menaquinone-9 beta-reductase